MVKKIREGCKQWLESNECRPGENTMNFAKNRKATIDHAESEDSDEPFSHVSRDTQRKKLQQVYLGL